MTIKKIEASHLDHGLTDEQVEHILSLPFEPGRVTVEVIQLPVELTYGD